MYCARMCYKCHSNNIAVLSASVNGFKDVNKQCVLVIAARWKNRSQIAEDGFDSSAYE